MICATKSALAMGNGLVSKFRASECTEPNSQKWAGMLSRDRAHQRCLVHRRCAGRASQGIESNFRSFKPVSIMDHKRSQVVFESLDLFVPLILARITAYFGMPYRKIDASRHCWSSSRRRLKPPLQLNQAGEVIACRNLCRNAGSSPD